MIAETTELSDKLETPQDDYDTADESISSAPLYFFYLIISSLIFIRLRDSAVYDKMSIMVYLAELENSYTARRLDHQLPFEIKSILENSSERGAITKPFVPMFPEYLIAKKHKLSVCLIPKNMSTLLSAIFCLINEPDKFNKKIYEERDRYCNIPYRYQKLEQVKAYFDNAPNMQNIVFVRDPVERFLSAFLMLCSGEDGQKCFDCEIDDMDCIAERLPNIFDDWSKGKYPMDTFLWHFSPQNWHCDLKHRLDKYYLVDYSPLREEEVTAELTQILLKADVNRNLTNSIREQMTSGETNHQTAHLVKRDGFARKLYGSKKILRILVRIFYYDFILFGYPFPEIV